jgi:hypothetical protein
MRLGWIDFSRNERNKIVSILRLLGTQNAIDELGIGTIRDAFSNELFPGISTLQTRAKYFVLLPYLFQLSRNENFVKRSDVKEWIYRHEDNLVKTLIENSLPNEEGIIGSRTHKEGRFVKYKPSTIYWNGLKTFDILRIKDGSIENVCDIVFQQSKSRAGISLKVEGEIGVVDDKDALYDSEQLFTPIYQEEGYLKNTSIYLTKNEAEYLIDRIITSESSKHSLLAYLLQSETDVERFQDIQLDSLPQSLKPKVKLAQDFADFIYGAHILYNVIYSEDKDLDMLKTFELWVDQDYTNVDLSSIIAFSKCSKRTGDFLHQFKRCIVNKEFDLARITIIEQEKYVKRDRSKLCKPHEYRYAKPIHDYKLNYRYDTAKVILRDIKKGLAL